MGVSRKDPTPTAGNGTKPAPGVPASHPFAHLLLLLISSVLAVYGFFPLPGNQIGFPHFVLILGYLYPLLLRWLRPQTGFWMGLILLLLLVSLAESAGVFVYELQTTGLLFPHGFSNDVLLSPVVLLSFAVVELSAFTLYLAGWSMLAIALKIFTRLSVPKPAPDKAKAGIRKTKLSSETKAAAPPTADEVHTKQ